MTARGKGKWQNVSLSLTEAQTRLARKMEEWAPFASCKGDPRFQQETEHMAPATRAAHIIELAEVCNTQCAVREECLEHAMSFPEPAGVWGGFGAQDRYDLRKNYRRRARR